jgi:signal transduction histidine kinase
MVGPSASPALHRAGRRLVPAALLGLERAARDEGRAALPVRRRRTPRDWAVDVLTFVFALGIGALGYAGKFGSPLTDAGAAFDLVAGLVLCGTLWVRRRWPVQLAVLSAVLATVSQSAGGAALILIFSLAVHRDARYVAAIAAVQSASIFVYAALWPDDTLGYWWLVLFTHVLTALLLAWGMVVRSRRLLVLSLRDRADRAEGEQQLRVAQARTQERARIAREMHDVLAHRISLVSLHAGALEFRPDAPPDEVARAAGVIRASAHEALEDLRQVIGVLRDGDSTSSADDVPAGAAETRPQPGLGDLPALLRESRDAGVRIEERLDTVGDGLPGATGRTAYRVVQEGLTNARKHAWGAVVRVRCGGAAGDGLTVEVRTPAAVGTAPGPEIPGAGTGLVGLRERVELAHGRLEAGPDADGGFLLRAWLPWPS